jgi:hypothetical protein
MGDDNCYYVGAYSQRSGYCSEGNQITTENRYRFHNRSDIMRADTICGRGRFVITYEVIQACILPSFRYLRYYCQMAVSLVR